MRTFPRELAAFRRIVKERAERLRKMSLEEIRRLGAEPVERIGVESRAATIGIIVQEMPSGAARVVVQGFMDSRWFRSVKSVALDGFYKHPNGSVGPMPNEEFYEFD